MNSKKTGLSFILVLLTWITTFAQGDLDRNYIQDYVNPYVVRLSFERAGAGLQISPDYTVIPATASFPFNTGTNLALNVYYKFLNFSISQSVSSKTNNKSFVIAAYETVGPVTIGGKIGFYSNVAALEDKKAVDTKTSINLFKFSPYWMYNFNHTRFSLAAINEYSKRQRKSAGAFMVEVNPLIMRAKGKGGDIIPTGGEYDKFGKMAGLEKLTVYNLDVRPGYMYTFSFEEGTYFLSGGLFVGAGFGFHHAVTEVKNTNGLHWQTSARILASGGYNQEKYFVAASLKYNNSFTPVSNIGVLSNEATFQLTVGIRIKSFENKLPSNF